MKIGVNATADWLVRIVLIGLAACMLFSGGLWRPGERNFPALPVWGEAREGDTWWYVWVFGLFCALLVASVSRPREMYLWLLAGLLLFLCVLDLNRLQPWTWFFLLAIGIVAAGATSSLMALRWLLAAVYIWGGANKLTPYFAEENFRWFCEVFESTAFLGNYPTLGYAVAVFEMILGLLLVFPRRNAWLGWIFIVFHGLIILSLLAARWNYVVIPWNAAMALLAFFLLASDGEKKRPNLTQAFLLLLAGFMPLAYYFNAWPYQLSWQLYTNTQPEAVFFSEKPCEKTGEVWQKKSFDEGRRLLVDDWSIQELGVPMFYSDHTFRQIGRYLCTCSPDFLQTRLIILYVDPWNKNAEQTTIYSCEEMK
ncbi:MAG: hypothetical protein LCH81_07125 [Bacteroidetes bacterium]|nr:hypothetical protein [Bacteroidota bacterium]